jgi:hypothetical protein
VYFDNDGVFGAVTPTTKRDADSSLIRNVLVDFEHLRGEITSLRSEVDTKFVAHDAKVNTIESQVVRHERSLRGAVPVNQREILAGASVAVAGVVLCGIVVYVIAKRR